VSLADRRGFTLLELTVALVMTAIISAAIAFTFSSGLRTYHQVSVVEERRQEAAVVLDLIRRDVQAATLGINGRSGLLVGETAGTEESPADTLRLTTMATGIERLRTAERFGRSLPGPVSDTNDVYYYMLTEGTETPGLYRRTMVPGTVTEPEGELLSDRVESLRLRYLSGDEWLDSWAAQGQGARLPQAVEIQIVVTDAAGEAAETFAVVVPVENGLH